MSKLIFAIALLVLAISTANAVPSVETKEDVLNALAQLTDQDQEDQGTIEDQDTLNNDALAQRNNLDQDEQSIIEALLQDIESKDLNKEDQDTEMEAVLQEDTDEDGDTDQETAIMEALEEDESDEPEANAQFWKSFKKRLRKFRPKSIFRKFRPKSIFRKLRPFGRVIRRFRPWRFRPFSYLAKGKRALKEICRCAKSAKWFCNRGLKYIPGKTKIACRAVQVMDRTVCRYFG